MQLEQITLTRYRITLHAYELATLVSAVRWITDGAKGDLSGEAVKQMERILEDYDKETLRLQES